MPSPHSSRGFTLIEVLVGMLILGFVVTTTLAVFVQRTRRLQRASEMMLAYQALANETEVRRRIDFGQLDGAQGTFLSDTSILAPLPGPVTSVQVVNQAPARKLVVLTISWRQGSQRAVLNLVRTSTGGSNLW